MTWKQSKVCFHLYLNVFLTLSQHNATHRNTTFTTTYRAAGYGQQRHNDHDQEYVTVCQDWCPVSPAK